MKTAYLRSPPGNTHEHLENFLKKQIASIK